MPNASAVGQFYTVLNSRFGSTTKLALEKEDEASRSFRSALASENALSAFMEAFAPKQSSVLSTRATSLIKPRSC